LTKQIEYIEACASGTKHTRVLAHVRALACARMHIHTHPRTPFVYCRHTLHCVETPSSHFSISLFHQHILPPFTSHISAIYLVTYVYTFETPSTYFCTSPLVPLGYQYILPPFILHIPAIHLTHSRHLLDDIYTLNTPSRHLNILPLPSHIPCLCSRHLHLASHTPAISCYVPWRHPVNNSTCRL